MANELEVQQAQQLSAQRSLNDLTNQLTLADHLVYLWQCVLCRRCVERCGAIR